MLNLLSTQFSHILFSSSVFVILHRPLKMVEFVSLFAVKMRQKEFGEGTGNREEKENAPKDGHMLSIEKSATASQLHPMALGNTARWGNGRESLLEGLWSLRYDA